MLEVYQLARKFYLELKKLTLNFPYDEEFELTFQIRRLSSSMATNLAEDSGRVSLNGKAHFTNISYSSASETIDHLNYVYDMEYIKEKIYSDLRKKLDEVFNKINSLFLCQNGQNDHFKNKF